MGRENFVVAMIDIQEINEHFPANIIQPKLQIVNDYLSIFILEC